MQDESEERTISLEIMSNIPKILEYRISRILIFPSVVIECVRFPEATYINCATSFTSSIVSILVKILLRQSSVYSFGP